MICPVCTDADLHRVPTTQGVEIDRCPACEGVWLERGEIFLFAAKTRSIAAKLERALADQKPTDRVSPASGEPMTEIAYRADFFAEMSIAALLKKVKVSAVRPVPCRLEGVIIGRGVPGYIFSEDFVMRDETGIIFLDYRQPLAIWEWFFGLLKAGGFQGASVTVEGWYRRAPVPYIELRSITQDGKVTKSWVATFNRLGAVAITTAGMAWAAATFLGLAPI